MSRNVYMRKCISLMKFAAEGDPRASVKEVKPTRESEETYMYGGNQSDIEPRTGTVEKSSPNPNKTHMLHKELIPPLHPLQ